MNSTRLMWCNFIDYWLFFSKQIMGKSHEKLIILRLSGTISSLSTLCQKQLIQIPFARQETRKLCNVTASSWQVITIRLISRRRRKWKKLPSQINKTINCNSVDSHWVQFRVYHHAVNYFLHLLVYMSLVLIV